ncbi:hypothetical protein [Nocardia sp. NPDC049149]|uniref:hypothetical protein n=1 Tax=Nocardia sp. NPDC049149 TaxID=3364315 RepID=UPI00371B2A1A
MAFGGRHQSAAGAHAGFIDPAKGNKYPPTWTLGNPAMRNDHVAMIHELAPKLLSREFTVVRAYEEVVQHAARMRAKHGSADKVHSEPVRHATPWSPRAAPG